MTSGRDMKAGSVLQSGGEERRRAPLDQLPPPANSNKPLTPFSIEDILNKPSVKKSVASAIRPPTTTTTTRALLQKVAGSNSARNGITTPSSPLCALEELASKTFKGLEVSVIQAAEGKDFWAFYARLCLIYVYVFGQLEKLWIEGKSEQYQVCTHARTQPHYRNVSKCLRIKRQTAKIGLHVCQTVNRPLCITCHVGKKTHRLTDGTWMLCIL